MHVYCPTEKVIALVGFLSPENLLLFPSQNVKFPGVHFTNQARVPIYDQILAQIETHCNVSSLRNKFELDPIFTETLRLHNEEATLYLGLVKGLDGTLPRYLHTLPILIRQMDKDRNRLAYLKAWQVLTGARDQDVRAVETKDL